MDEAGLDKPYSRENEQDGHVISLKGKMVGTLGKIDSVIFV